MDADTLPPFQLEPVDNAATRWEKWIRRFDNFLVAKAIESAQRQKAMLLHLAGEEVFDLSENIGVTDEDDFEDTKQKLHNYFAPKRNIEYEVFVFRQATQQNSESLDKFNARLTSLSKYCNFTEREREIKSQIIQKCLNEKVRDKGLTDPNITLADLLTYGRTLEATKLQVQAMVSPMSNDKSAMSLNAVNINNSGNSRHSHAQRKSNYSRFSHQKADSSKSKRQNYNNGAVQATTCPGCGGSPHHRRYCRAWGKICHNCKKRNHFSIVCRSQNGPSKPTHFMKTENSNPKEIVNIQPLCNEYDNLSLFRTETSNFNVKPYCCTLSLNSKPTIMEIDTGASVSLISSEQAEILQRDGPQLLIETNNLPILRTYSGETMQPRGRVILDVVYQEKTFQLPCLIVQGNGPNLLGRDWLQHLNLNFTNIYQVDSENFVKMFPELFEPGLGRLKNVKATLHVDKNVTPRYFKPRTVPISMRTKVETELDRLVKEGILKPVEFSEWGAPIVPVLKPNGDIRICGDYRLTVNAAAKVDRHPIPNIDDLHANLRGGVCFSKLDLSHAYQQVCLDDDSQKLTTISTTKGLFSYTRLCYGVSSAPGIFQRIMEQLLKGIPMVIVYLDDIIVSGRTDREARVNLITVLSRLQDAGLKLNSQKCRFLQPMCESLGHRLDRDGIHPTNEKIAAIQNAPLPTCVTELKSYLGLINYYHKFIDNLSSVLAPLYKLLRKNESWHWTKEQQTAFNKSKELLQSSRVLVHYNPDLPLMLSCDASPYGVGAVLSHQMADGSDKPVAYTSRSLAPAEKNYAQIDREALAIMFGLNKFHKYLYGREFTIQTDHKPLLGLLKEDRLISPMASARMQRWALTLSNYQYHMRYKCGNSNANADGLSRLPLSTTCTDVPVPVETVLTMSLLNETPVTAALIKQWTGRDPILSKVRHAVLNGDNMLDVPEFKPYNNRQNELSVEQGVLLWGNRAIIPPQGRDRILNELHECHPGVVRMKGLARSYIWWPGMDTEIEKKVKECERCQINANINPVATLHPWEWPGQPWYRIHIDYAGPFEGKMILVIVDAHSKYIDAHLVSSSTTDITLTKLRQTFATLGLPNTIVSDNGTCFTSAQFEEFCKMNGIKHITSSPYHPASNGLAERAVQTIKAGLRKSTGNLEDRLYRLLFTYRVTPQTTTGTSPAELIFKRVPKTRLSLVLPSVQNRVRTKQETDIQKHHSDKRFHYFYA